jgi:hypothetical protein
MTGFEWSVAEFGLLALFAVFVGAAIGSTGIGGVLLAPWLIAVQGMPVLPAVATTIAAFILVGASGTVIYARRGLLDWRMAGWLSLGAVPGAVAGSFAVAAVPPAFVATGIALMMVLAGLDGLRRGSRSGREFSLGPAVLAVIGFVVGVVSGMSGTGGPVTLAPILVALGQAPIGIVALSQVIQIPISGSAIATHLAEGRIFWPATIAMAAGMIAGLRIGAGLVIGRDPALLRRLLGMSLVVAGGFLLVRQIVTF